jgi:hypothetical protein
MTTMVCPVILVNGGHPDHIGIIPHWLDKDDPRKAAEQLDQHYQHGGGWQPFKGFTYKPKRGHTLTYPGDPPMHPLGFMKFRDEMIVWYPHAWVMILQKDGTFEICRMD